MKQGLTWPVRLAPMVAAQVFLWFTLALFAFGPWRWPLQHPLSLYAFLIAAHMALLAGYLTAAHAAPSDRPMRIDPHGLLRASLWVTVLVLPLACYARTGHWVPDIVGGILNPGKAYAEAHQYSENQSNFAAYVRILASPWLVVVFPLGFLLRKRLSWPTRLMMIGCMIAVMLMSLATGQRRDIADLLITVPFVVMGAHWSGLCRLSRRTIIAASAATLLLVSCFAAYFTYSHVSRIGEEAAAYSANPATRQLPDLDNPLICALPAAAQPGALGLVNYLTTGYYGLGLALDRPTLPMYGMGHSMFLTRNFERLINDESFESRSLPVQISDKDGFKYPVLWCTAYPYFANDLGFVGTVLMLFLVGRGLAQTWIEVLGGRNPVAVVFFSLLLILIFYLPATNRMLQDGEGVAAFYVWLAVWLSGRLARRTAPALQLA